MKLVAANGHLFLQNLSQSFDSGRAIYWPDAGPEGRRWASEHAHDDVVLALFDICYALHWLDPNAIPADWQFHMGGDGRGYDYRECDNPLNDGGDGCYRHNGECDSSRDILLGCGVNLNDPFDTTFAQISHGERAVATLRYAGTVLSRYDALLRRYYGDQ